MRAHKLFARDTDYIVRDDKVVIIDEFTGRMMEGRRYSEGLHQALEAKEGVTVQNENQTLASITFQNYFRLYPKLAGMTGTAMTEATEFQDIYKLDVIEIPTNEPCIRNDNDDEVYRTAREKYEVDPGAGAGMPRAQAAGADRHRQHREIRGAVSDSSRSSKIQHHVLNARYHEQEAFIIAQAGRPGDGDHRHQHGRAAAPTSSWAAISTCALKQELPAIDDPAAREPRAAEIRAEIEAAREEVRQGRRALHHRQRAA